MKDEITKANEFAKRVFETMIRVARPGVDFRWKRDGNTDTHLVFISMSGRRDVRLRIDQGCYFASCGRTY